VPEPGDVADLGDDDLAEHRPNPAQVLDYAVQPASLEPEHSASHGWHPERTHRATAERVLARQGVRRDRPAHRPGDPVPQDTQDERAAQIELGKLLAMAQAGRQRDSGVTVAQLLDQNVSTAGWDVSTRESNLG
jgi:hypothetical protein